MFPLSMKKQVIVQYLETLEGLAAIFVHGSVARGTEHPGSDLDLALLFRHGHSISPMQQLEISGELENLLGRPVHLGILSTDNPVFAVAVLGDGKRIYCRDERFCDTFSMYAYAFYAELSERRKPILDAYRSPSPQEVKNVR